MTTETTTRSTILERYVGGRASQLQREYRNDVASAVAVLARLRRAMPTGRAINADTWDVFTSMPEELLGQTDLPSREEYAAVVTLALFATHQQSRKDADMHQPGYEHGFGRAVGRMAAVTGAPGVSRRFRALLRSADLPQALPHLRGLVTQLRGERISVDYGRLASDLARFDDPRSIHVVRMRWTRDFHRPALHDAPDESAPTTTNAPTGDDQ